MRLPRLILCFFCLVFLPIFLTLFSFLLSSSSVTSPNPLAGRTSGLRAFFSFNVPSSLFPPSAIISLTDDNSTFFLARPAAFGPLLPAKGLSGQLWVGSGFGETADPTAAGELGCSDIPGWEEGRTRHKQDKVTTATENMPGKSVAGTVGGGPAALQNRRQTESGLESKSQNGKSDSSPPPSTNDGTDDHLHHPLPESDAPGESTSDKRSERSQSRPPAHADIQSLQESAEIAGKVVLLSRGGCGFLEKVKWAQRRGAIALIVGDDTKGGSLVTMYARGDTSNISIPSIFTSYTTAHLLSSLVPPQIIGNDASLKVEYKPSHTRPGSPGKQDSGSWSTATPSAVPSPISTGYSMSTSNRKAGLFSALFSLFGIGNRAGKSSSSVEDSHRPPSSGNIDWVLMDHWDEQLASPDISTGSTNNGRGGSLPKPPGNPPSKSSSTDGDGFLIGIQDWRDPDVVAAKGSQPPKPSRAARKEGSPSRGSGKGSESTPGSAEDDSNISGWSGTAQSIPDPPLGSRQRGSSGGEKSSSASNFPSREDVDVSAHSGLWVTLTPASMSTSPFFDTLLVLVVSPLLTLSVVYALLLLRSRIRRRRWRAPKSVVDRLPVRTYHTITTTSSTTGSVRSSSPDSSSPTDPLLGLGGRSDLPSSRQRSQTMSGIVSGTAESAKVTASTKGQNSGAGSTLWRRKYTGRQVECVVCLEEYVDGQSRVMSLPCGHEFHAECITPWLTTRRRTCPICKGDVVRSLSEYGPMETRPEHEQTADNGSSHDLGASSAPVGISDLGEDGSRDVEQHAGSDAGFREGRTSSAPTSSWANFPSLGFSIFNGDTIWHQRRGDRNR
ncbi:hypothetical protein MPDQ_002262 [Monascus purpureus]|uniref:RING-type E3 ubiquitin transferase n=1 Tax=Monascus purpureus TaxID=5098 RepID=A0A507QZV8_MONPU|nr:hypothetical protein MPDQ_002262 [Monascus purpureus]BDD59979.1 hypothetical protein MAP00_005145 [Monascus purpureus]